MFDAILKYESLDEACAECFGFSDVTMLRDFGPLKKEQKIDGIWFQLETGMVEVYKNEPYEKIMEFPFHLEA